MYPVALPVEQIARAMEGDTKCPLDSIVTLCVKDRADLAYKLDCLVGKFNLLLAPLGKLLNLRVGLVQSDNGSGAWTRALALAGCAALAPLGAVGRWLSSCVKGERVGRWSGRKDAFQRLTE